MDVHVLYGCDLIDQLPHSGYKHLAFGPEDSPNPDQKARRAVCHLQVVDFPILLVFQKTASSSDVIPAINGLLPEPYISIMIGFPLEPEPLGHSLPFQLSLL